MNTIDELKIARRIYREYLVSVYWEKTFTTAYMWTLNRAIYNEKLKIKED